MSRYRERQRPRGIATEADKVRIAPKTVNYRQFVN